MRSDFTNLTRRRFLIATAGILSWGFPVPVSAGYGGITPNAQFYVTTYAVTPRVDPQSWRLRIGGLVKQPLALDFFSLQQLPHVRQEMTLECIGNPPNGSLIGNAWWEGTNLAALLERVGIKRQAVYAVLRAADGYSTGIALDELLRKQNFIAYRMNGVPLPAAHGYPARIFIPGKFGMKQPKWLTEIELVDRPYLGYWEKRGWSNSAWRKLNSGFFYPPTAADASLITRLTQPHRVRTPVELSGWAINGPAGVRRVEVRAAGASWHQATLVRNHSPYIWTVWKYRFTAKPGRYEISVRATGGDGAVQPAAHPADNSGTEAQARIVLDVL
ncbi:MAG TPA: molybdopterin-dependent oxidoreductase [Candidatus Binataceae bacterium]|nr:molybdopterin-dependent oxidoreductase [Candidatus Binataceae bacterium]